MQLKKQARKLTRPTDDTRVHAVPARKFNPVLPKGIEMTFASFYPKDDMVLVATQRRLV